MNKIILFYWGFVWSVMFLITLYSVSSVTYCANKSYKTLNSMIISYSKHNKHFYNTRIRLKFKVYILSYLSLNIELINRVVFIQTRLIYSLNEWPIGFSCWVLFTINYFRCYEVSYLLYKISLIYFIFIDHWIYGGAFS